MITPNCDIVLASTLVLCNHKPTPCVVLEINSHWQKLYTTTTRYRAEQGRRGKSSMARKGKINPDQSKWFSAVRYGLCPILEQSMLTDDLCCHPKFCVFFRFGILFYIFEEMSCSVNHFEFKYLTVSRSGLILIARVGRQSPQTHKLNKMQQYSCPKKDLDYVFLGGTATIIRTSSIID